MVFDLAKHWQPTPKNELIRRSKATNRLRVGGTGSSKSSDALMEGLEYMLRYPGIGVLFIRRQLTDLKKSSILDWKEFVPEELYHWNDQDKIATLHHNGSKLFFGHLPNNSEKDLQQYLSAAFPVIILDECGQFAGTAWQFLQSRNRINRECKPDANGNMPIPVMLGCTNPVGAFWAFYNAQFVQKKPYEPPDDTVRDRSGRYWVPDAAEAIGFRLIYNPDDWDYVHSTILDNPFLMERDPDQLAKLQKLPEPMRSKFLKGELDSTVGQFFDVWDEARHVIDLAKDPAAIIWQPWEPRWIGWDYGRVHWNVVLWFTMALVRCGDGEFRSKCVCYREYADRGKTSRETVPSTARLNNAGLPYGPKDATKIKTIYFSHEKFSLSAEKKEKLSIADRITTRLKIVGLPRLTPNDASPGSRVKKAATIYEKFQNDEVVILSSCHGLIESIPQLIRDESNLEDVLKIEGVNKADDFYDAFAMGLHNWDFSARVPFEVEKAEKVQRAFAAAGPMAADIVRLSMEAKRKGKQRWTRGG